MSKQSNQKYRKEKEKELNTKVDNVSNNSSDGSLPVQDEVFNQYNMIPTSNENNKNTN